MTFHNVFLSSRPLFIPPLSVHSSIHPFLLSQHLMCLPASHVPPLSPFLSLYLLLTFNIGWFFLSGHALSSSLQLHSLVLLTGGHIDYSTAECEIVTSQCGPLTITDCLVKIMSSSPSTYSRSCQSDVFNHGTLAPRTSNTHHTRVQTHTHTQSISVTVHFTAAGIVLRQMFYCADQQDGGLLLKRPQLSQSFMKRFLTGHLFTTVTSAETDKLIN